MRRNRRSGTTAQTGVPVWMLELMFLTVGALVWLLFYFILRTTIEGCPAVYPPKVTTSELAPAFPGESYNMELAKKGTCAEVTWHLVEEGSADWLRIDKKTGRLSADRVPQIKDGDTEEFTAVVYVKSQCNVKEHRSPGPKKWINGMISRRETEPMPLRLATDCLPTAIAGEEYTYRLAADGGYPFTDGDRPRYQWSLVDGSDKLQRFGITLQEDGTFQGHVDPEAFGDDNEDSFNVNLAVSDSRDVKEEAEVEFSLKKMVLEHNMEIVLPNEQGRLSESVAGKPFYLPLSVVGGEPPYNWRIEPSSTGAWERAQLQCNEEAGLLWSEKLIMPNPDRTKADIGFKVVVKDGRGKQTDAEFLLPIRAVEGTRPLKALSRSFPTGILGKEYTLERLSARDGVGEYAWSAEDIPPGMELSLKGVFRGTPIESGRHSFKVVVEDEAGGSASFQASFLVREYDEVWPLKILTPEELPTAIIDQPFDLQFAARGGKGEKLTWEIADNSANSAMNANLQLSSGGRLTSRMVKRATNDNPIELRIAVRDEAGRQTESTFTLPLEDIGFDPEDLLILSDQRLPDVSMGSPITQALSATGGVPYYDWTLELKCHDDIREYIQLREHGVLSIDVPRLEGWEGRPPERVDISATVRDQLGNTEKKNFVFYVVPGKDDVPPPSLHGGELPAAIVDESYRLPLAVIGGVPPYLCEIQGVLPPGLKFDEENMYIHGTPEEEIEAGEFGIVVTDMRGDQAAADFAMQVKPEIREPGVPVLWWMEIIAGIALLVVMEYVLQKPLEAIQILRIRPEENQQLRQRAKVNFRKLVVLIAVGMPLMLFVLKPLFSETDWYGYLVIGIIITGAILIYENCKMMVINWKGLTSGLQRRTASDDELKRLLEQLQGE